MSNYQDAFAFRVAPGRIRFGSGSFASLPEEIEAIQCERALVLSTPNQSEDAKRVAEILGPRVAGIYTKAAMHTPVDARCFLNLWPHSCERGKLGACRPTFSAKNTHH
jgi:hypothetical protein